MLSLSSLFKFVVDFDVVAVVVVVVVVVFVVVVVVVVVVLVVYNDISVVGGVKGNSKMLVRHF